MSKNQQAVAGRVYEASKKYLVPKDGEMHVIMFESFSKFVNGVFQCESKYTSQINEILDGMRRDGYEIVDVKLSIVKNQSAFTGKKEGYYTLIMYK